MDNHQSRTIVRASLCPARPARCASMCTPTLCAKLAQTSGQEAYYPEREKRYTFFPFPVLLAPTATAGGARSHPRLWRCPHPGSSARTPIPVLHLEAVPSHAKQRELTVESSNSSTAGWDWPKAVTKDKGEAERVRCWFILSSHRTSPRGRAWGWFAAIKS
eukprot:scaffold72092_cov72-Phaeocystis_antarctica.AAC.2